MSEQPTPFCPECEEGANYYDRRDFLRVVGGTTAAVAIGATVPAVARAADTKTEPKPTKKPRPAEELIKELFSGLDAEQKKSVVLPWDHISEHKAKIPARMAFFNRSLGKPIKEVYTKPQQELVERILRSISSDEAGWKCMSRDGTWDASGSFDNCGAHLFGDPTSKQWAWVFSGHHLTVRCDGNSVEGPAFGGPIYYGHTPNPYSPRNVFNFQTKEVMKLYDALDEKQRAQAVVKRGIPGEHEPSVQFKKKDHPGIALGELSKDQQGLVEKFMRTLLSPYRPEDVDEVMAIVKANGGRDKIHLAFYPDSKMNDEEPWHYWRLDGPGFVWNFRVMPHVHTYVSISSKLA